MKRAVYLIFFIFCSAPGFAQEKAEVLQTNTATAMARIDLATGQLNPRPLSEKPDSPLSGFRVSLRSGDIILDYQLAPLQDKATHYEIVPRLKFAGEPLPLSAYDELRGDWGDKLAPGSRQMQWINPLDRYINLDGDLEVILTVRTWGKRKMPYDCSLGEPLFSSRQRLPYYIAAGAGVASIGLGQLFRSERDDIYDNQYLNAKNLQEATNFYDQANSKHQTYLALTYIGVGILITDATLYFIRQRKFRRDHKVWEEWCPAPSSSFHLRPSLDIPGPANPSGSVGLRVSLSF